MSELADALLSFSGRGLLLCHQNADLDCTGCAIALKEALKDLNPRMVLEIGAAEGFSKPAKHVLEAFSVQPLVNPELDYGLIVILDTSSLHLLSPLDDALRAFEGRVLVIDHHPTVESLRSLALAALIDDTASSTSEMVYGLLGEMRAEVRGSIAEALMIGIYADTGHLKYATPRALRIVGDILEDSDFDYERVLSLLSSTEDFSEKLAHLKAAQRLVIHRLEDYLLVTSEVNSYTSSAANALVNIGADCVFVGSQKKEETQVSARASASFILSTGIDLGEIMGTIGELINGSGGGHRGAAAAKGSGDLKKTLEECVAMVQDYLRTKGSTVSSDEA